jgi:hypothetical protein
MFRKRNSGLKIVKSDYINTFYVQLFPLLNPFSVNEFLSFDQ